MLVHREALVAKEVMEKADLKYQMVQFTQTKENLLAEATDGYILIQLFFPKADKEEAFFPADIAEEIKGQKEIQKVVLSRETCENISKSFIAKKWYPEYFFISDCGEKLKIYVGNSQWTVEKRGDNEMLPDFEAVFPKEKQAFKPYSLATRFLKKIVKIAGKLKMINIKFEGYGGGQAIKFSSDNVETEVKMIGLLMPFMEE